MLYYCTCINRTLKILKLKLISPEILMNNVILAQVYKICYLLFCRYLTHKCFPNAVPNTIHCNELFMMHVGLAPSQFIAGQCRELASLLWDSSGEIYQSMNLL